MKILDNASRQKCAVFYCGQTSGAKMHSALLNRSREDPFFQTNAPNQRAKPKSQTKEPNQRAKPKSQTKEPNQRAKPKRETAQETQPPSCNDYSTLELSSGAFAHLGPQWEDRTFDPTESLCLLSGAGILILIF